MPNLIGESTDETVPAVKGVSNPNGGIGVHGVCDIGHGVRGESIGGRGVVGKSQTFVGVSGHSVDQIGVAGESDNNIGVFGKSPHGFGVQGVSETNHGVHGESTAGRGVVGTSQTFVGVFGHSVNQIGVSGESDNDVGVFGKGGRLAGLFEGDVVVTGHLKDVGDISCRGDVRLLNADCAEDFDIADAVEPGTVMVLKEDGALRESHQAYDKRVAGVISGAGGYRPGIVLDNQESQTKRLPIGLLGKVYCKVDAQSSSIEVGDLLTTSCTLGHAMKASDPLKAFGSVIGKALRPLAGGQGLIPILVALQ